MGEVIWRVVRVETCRFEDFPLVRQPQNLNAPGFIRDIVPLSLKNVYSLVG